jgi:hypothetical protein
MMRLRNTGFETYESYTVFHKVYTSVCLCLLFRAVRQAMKSRESPDVQAAILAVHLGLIDEAEKILAGIYCTVQHCTIITVQ